MKNIFKRGTAAHELVKRCRSGFRKHAVIAGIGETVTHVSGWSGGSRTFLSFHRVSDGAPVEIAPTKTEAGPFGFSGPSRFEFRLVPGVVAIEHGTFCGKQATPVVTIHPADAALIGE